MTIEFRDLKRQYEEIKDSIDNQISSIISRSHFIGGPEVKKLETVLAEYVGRKHCITCANGTDAISISLMAAGIGTGDAVFVPDFTFFSSGECPAAVGATPVFVDVSRTTYNMSVESLISSIESVLSEGVLKPKAVIAVDLFGQPYDYEAIKAVCDKYNLFLVEDAAQGFGGHYIDSKGKRLMAGALGDISTTSFFPAKPLGCYGDGGAIFTDDDNLAILCHSIAVHGKDMEHPDDPNAKYNNVRLGMNSRLDTLQAGILLAKFPTFVDEELEAVNHVADMYTAFLSDVEELVLPRLGEKYYSSWAQYTIQLPKIGTIEDQLRYRKDIQAKLGEQGIPTNIYYVKPMHKQGAFVATRSADAECPVTELLCGLVLCLPIHPYLNDEEVEMICSQLKQVLKTLPSSI